MSVLSERFSRELVCVEERREPTGLKPVERQRQLGARLQGHKVARFVGLMLSVCLDRDVIAWFRSRTPEQRDAVSKVVNAYFASQMAR